MRLIKFALLAAFLITLSYLFIHYFETSEVALKKAQERYLAGINAKTVAERTENLNMALNIYHDLESKYNPRYGNGMLYYNMGNTLFALEQYPWAILYYYRALSLSPRNEDIQNNLQIALKKQDIVQPVQKETYFRNIMAIPHRIQILVLIFLLFFGCNSLYIWLKINWLKKASTLFGVLAAAVICSVIWSYFFVPLEGIIVKSSVLTRGPGKQFLQVQEEPVPSGSRVEVLDVTNDGTWLKIKKSDGVVGYVSHDKIRLI